MFFIDFRKSKLEIKETTQQKIDKIIESTNAPSDLFLKYEIRIFKNRMDAEIFLQKYRNAECKLQKLKDAKNKQKTAILYKKRYLVFTMIGEKNFTERISEYTIENMSKVKIGEKFRLYDQTNFLDVVLTGRKNSRGIMRYEFKLE